MKKQFLLKKFIGRKRKRSAAVANDAKNIHIKQERKEEALAEICVTAESKKLKLFLRSWKSRRIWMSWMNSQSWKQNYSGLLWHDFAVTAAVVPLIRSSSQSRRRRHSYVHPIALSKSRERTPPCTIPPWPFSFLPDQNA